MLEQVCLILRSSRLFDRKVFIIRGDREVLLHGKILICAEPMQQVGCLEGNLVYMHSG